MKEKFPNEIIVYCFNKYLNFFIFSISNLQGWSLLKIESKYILIDNFGLYLYNSFHLFKIYNIFVINFLFGLYKNHHIFLRFKGIGYKIMKIGLNFLLKIGFSHRIIYLMKKNVRFSYHNKQLLKIESRSLFNLKNIIFIFQKIRKINCYKMKGIFLKGSIVKIKINKKKIKV
jgi:hypothetical protein